MCIDQLRSHEPAVFGAFALVLLIAPAHLWAAGADLPFGGPNVYVGGLAVLAAMVSVVLSFWRSGRLRAVTDGFLPVFPVLAIGSLLTAWACCVYLGNGHPSAAQSGADDPGSGRVVHGVLLRDDCSPRVLRGPRDHTRHLRVCRVRVRHRLLWRSLPDDLAACCGQRGGQVSLRRSDVSNALRAWDPIPSRSATSWRLPCRLRLRSCSTAGQRTSDGGGLWTR